MHLFLPYTLSTLNPLLLVLSASLLLTLTLAAPQFPFPLHPHAANPEHLNSDHHASLLSHQPSGHLHLDGPKNPGRKTPHRPALVHSPPATSEGTWRIPAGARATDRPPRPIFERGADAKKEKEYPSYAYGDPRFVGPGARTWPIAPPSQTDSPAERPSNPIQRRDAATVAHAFPNFYPSPPARPAVHLPPDHPYLHGPAMPLAYFPTPRQTRPPNAHAGPHSHTLPRPHPLDKRAADPKDYVPYYSYSPAGIPNLTISAVTRTEAAAQTQTPPPNLGYFLHTRNAEPQMFPAGFPPPDLEAPPAPAQRPHYTVPAPVRTTPRPPLQRSPARRVHFAPSADEAHEPVPDARPMAAMAPPASRPRKPSWWSRMNCLGKNACVRGQRVGVVGLRERDAMPFHESLWGHPYAYTPGSRIPVENYAADAVGGGGAETPLPGAVGSGPKKAGWRERAGLGLGCFGKSCVKERDGGVGGLQERDAASGGLRERNAKEFYTVDRDGSNFARTTVTVPPLVQTPTPRPALPPSQHHPRPSRPRQDYIPWAPAPIFPPANARGPNPFRDTRATPLENLPLPGNYPSFPGAPDAPLANGRGIAGPRPTPPAGHTPPTRHDARLAAANPRETPAAQVDWGYGHIFPLQKRDAKPDAKHATHLYHPHTSLPSSTTRYPAARARQTPPPAPLVPEFPYEGPFWKRNADPIDAPHALHGRSSVSASTRHKRTQKPAFNTDPDPRPFPSASSPDPLPPLSPQSSPGEGSPASPGGSPRRLSYGSLDSNAKSKASGAPLMGDLGGTSYFMGDGGARAWGSAESGRSRDGVAGVMPGRARGAGRGAGRGPRRESEAVTPESSAGTGGRSTGSGSGKGRGSGRRGRDGKEKEKEKPKAAGPAEGSPYYQSNPSYAPEWRKGGGGKWY